MSQIHSPIFIVSLFLLLNSVQCQRECHSRSNKLDSLLKNMLSPGNMESLKQLKIAASRRNKPYANSIMANQYYANTLPNVMPANMLPNVMPANMLPNAYMPANVLPNAYLPASVLPNAYLPANVFPNAYSPANVLPNAYLPTNVLPNAYLPPNILPTAYLPSNILPNVPICEKQMKPKLVEAVDVPKRTCACQVPVTPSVVLKEPPALPTPMINPYLPAASPVSALAPPTSSLLPPADFQRCRCNFLRKIPIPPPSL